MKTLKVKICQEHIDEGIECDDFNCPIVLALNSAGYKNVKVGGADIEIDCEIWYHSKESEDFIDEFDWDLPVKPCTLTLFETRPNPDL